MPLLNIRLRISSLVLLVFLPLIFAGCESIKNLLPIRDVSTQGINAINDAIDKIGRDSSQWQQILNDLPGKVAGEAQTTIRNEVSSLLTRTIAATGAEIRCDSDFYGERVSQALVRLRAKLLNQPIPPAVPAFCQVDPPSVVREDVPEHIKQLAIYGYNFDTTSTLKVFLERTSGAPIDVTAKLDRPTHYLLTLKFGDNGVQLANDSQRFRMEWNGKEISSIGVIQPSLKVCKVDSKEESPGSVTHDPPLVAGDADYWGHGPAIQSKVELKTTPGSIDAEIYLKAQETEGNQTRVEGTRSYRLYTVEPGWQIQGLASPSKDEHSYIDTNTDMDFFDRGGGPVKRLEYVGRRDGANGAKETKVKVIFNSLMIERVQNKDCIAPQTLQQLHQTGRLSDRVFNRVEAEVNENLSKGQFKR